MIKTITAIERDGLNIRTMRMTFDVPDKDFDLVSAVKEATMEYCLTEEGRKIYSGNCDCFNWADFEMYVTNEFCEKHGFRRIDGDVSDIIVDWDEQLVDLDLEDFKNK